MPTRASVFATIPFSQSSESRSSMRHRCVPSAWPTDTRLHCWNCCHQFDNVPAFLPVSRDFTTGVFHLSGLFCSWNCAKAYRYSHPQFCHKDAASFLPVFAFLTSHRPRYCPNPLTRAHSCDCQCLDYSHRVIFPPPKENLQMFGGHMTIYDYRKGFMTIDDINWVTRCFTLTKQFKDKMGCFGRLRQYLYDFVPIEPTNHDTRIEKERKSNEYLEEPEVMIDGIDESFFY